MDKVRLDKWLWAARFFKTRGLATEAIKGGKVKLNGVSPKPSKTVAVDDQLEVTQPHRKVWLKVRVLSDRRGPAEVAQTLYVIEKEQINQRKLDPAIALAGFREKGKGRPTKRDRRQIERLLGD
jgi:ribosome-associated heat shock protein Hsp15